MRIRRAFIICSSVVVLGCATAMVAASDGTAKSGAIYSIAVSGTT